MNNKYTHTLLHYSIRPQITQVTIIENAKEIIKISHVLNEVYCSYLLFYIPLQINEVVNHLFYETRYIYPI